MSSMSRTIRRAMVFKDMNSQQRKAWSWTHGKKKAHDVQVPKRVVMKDGDDNNEVG